MRRTLLPSVVVGALLLGACGGAGRPELSDQTLPPRACSADGLVVGPLDSDGIPSAVARTRQQLIDAAVACDYRALGRLARRHGVDLRFEGEVVPVAQWEEREHDGMPILRPLAGLLGLAWSRGEGAGGGQGDSAFTWPTAVDWPFKDVADGQERAALVEVVGEEGIYGWGEHGGYVGWRTTIAGDGTWASFLLGPAG